MEGFQRKLLFYREGKTTLHPKKIRMLAGKDEKKIDIGNFC